MNNNLFITGQYLQITLPYEIILTSCKFQGALDKVIPTSWYICGSNDGILFNVLDSQDDSITTMVGLILIPDGRMVSSFDNCALRSLFSFSSYIFTTTQQ